MRGIGAGLGVARTVGARKDRVVVRIDVAGGTDAVGVSVIDVPPGVIEGRTGPGGRVVASCASGGENCRGSLMDGIRGAVVIRCVAAVAVGGKSGVVVVHVAAGAGDLDVETRQRKRGRVVVKRPLGPESRIVAKLASRGESHLDVINRGGRGVVILEVARDAGGVGARQTVIVVDMAVRAHAWRDQM